MKTLRLAIFAICALLLGAQVQARPNVIDEWARLPLPTDDDWEFVGAFGVAIDGDWALVSAFSNAEGDEGPVWDSVALLYHYTGGSWQYSGILGTRQPVDEWHRPGIAMKGGIAVVSLRDTRIFELVNGTWTQVPYSLPASVQLAGEDIEIEGGRILIPLHNNGNSAYVLRKLNGAWSVEGQLSGHPNDSSSENPVTPKMDLQGARAVILNLASDIYSENPATVRRYMLNERFGYGWFEQNTVTDPAGLAFGPHIAMSGTDTAYTDRREFGTRVIIDHETGGHSATYGLQPVDGFLQPNWRSDTGIERVRGLFATRNYSHDRRAHVWNVFRMNEDDARTGEHLYTLQAGNGDSLGGWIDASGNRVIVSGMLFGQSQADSLYSNTVRIYQLPTTHDPIAAQTFGFDMPNTPAGWQLSPGSTFTVTRANGNGVWRQPSTDGAPAAWLTTNRRTTQSIQAEITLRAISGSDRWVGLATRRTDDSNYYYVTLRTNGRIELKRMRNGVFTTLRGAPATLAVGTKVRLRLESIGGTHRVYLNDRQVLTAYDFNLREGSVGLLMNRAATDFDDVIAGPAPFTTIYSDDFATGSALDPWTVTEGAWQRTGGVIRQSSTAGYARLTVGARTDDQVVQVRVRPTSFTAPGNWVGVLLRYQDARNHTYLALQGRGNVSLWRRTNGVIQQLGTRNLPVSIGSWYTLRVQNVGNATSVYVDDVWQFSSNADLGPSDPDVASPKGTVGIITQQSTADFDDFLAYQP